MDPVGDPDLDSTTMWSSGGRWRRPFASCTWLVRWRTPLGAQPPAATAEPSGSGPRQGRAHTGHLTNPQRVGTAFGAEGRTLLAEHNNTYSGSLWDAGDRRRPTLLAAIPTGSDPQAGPDNHVVMTNGAQEGTVELWDVTDPERPVRVGDVTTTAHLALARGGVVLFGPLDDGRLIGSFDTDFVPVIRGRHRPPAPQGEDQDPHPPRTTPR